MKSLKNRECLGEREIQIVLARTPYSSKPRVSPNIHGRHRKLRRIELAEQRLLEMTYVRIARDIQLVKSSAVLCAGTVAGGTAAGAGIIGGAGKGGTAILHCKCIPRLHRSDPADTPTGQQLLRPSRPGRPIDWAPYPAIDKAMAMGLVRFAAIVYVPILKPTHATS